MANARHPVSQPARHPVRLVTRAARIAIDSMPEMRQMSEKTPTVVTTVGVTSLVCPKIVYGVKISLRQGEHFSDSSIYQ